MTFDNHDNPISNKVDDVLGFEPLAKRIANSIIGSNIDTTNSFTIAIEGKWGSGKTSLVNLIRNEIKDEVIVLKFNPWMINDFEQLIKYFFSEFTKIVMKEIHWSHFYPKSKVIKSIKKMASFLTPDSIRMGGKSFSTTYKTKDLFFADKTIYELKSEINTHLKQLNKRIVIIVDDIDRLTDKETETFFRLIKGIADFDNLVYLLLYDKAIVFKSLEQFKKENGEKYLDKIVQYSISIPKVHQSDLNGILLEKIEKILEENPNHFFNKDKWSELIKILDKYIMNIRDINKVINTISFEYPQISEDVEFTDFFIISLIKVQKYELYEFIRDRRYIFYNRGTTEDNVQEDIFMQEALKPFHLYRELIYLILPNSFKGSSIQNQEKVKHHDKFLESSEYFNNYFTFSVSSDKLSNYEYKSLEEKLISDNHQLFQDAIKVIKHHPEKIELFLEIFNEYLNNKKDDSTYDKNKKNIFINFLTIDNIINNDVYGVLTKDNINKHDFYSNLVDKLITKNLTRIMDIEYIDSIDMESKLKFFKKSLEIVKSKLIAVKKYELQSGRFTLELTKVLNFLNRIIPELENNINK